MQLSSSPEDLARLGLHSKQRASGALQWPQLLTGSCVPMAGAPSALIPCLLHERAAEVAGVLGVTQSKGGEEGRRQEERRGAWGGGAGWGMGRVSPGYWGLPDPGMGLGTSPCCIYLVFPAA